MMIIRILNKNTRIEIADAGFYDQIGNDGRAFGKMVTCNGKSVMAEPTTKKLPV